MIDSVFFNCPHSDCGKKIEMQSSVHDPYMAVYPRHAVPLDVAEDICRVPFLCKHCHRPVYCRIIAGATVPVEMIAVKEQYED